MTDTPQNIRTIQLRIWLSKPPMERLRQMMIDNEAMINFWSVTRRIDKSTPSQKNEPGINRPAF